VRTSPVSLWRNRPEGPPQRNVEGSRHQWALAAAFSPGSLPQRAVAAGAERKNDGPHVWFQRWAQIVSTKTY
jgi:hypothetical protein